MFALLLSAGTSLTRWGLRVCGGWWATRLLEGFTAPKLLWVRDVEPEVFDEVRTVLLPKDYVRLLMTGEKATEPSDAAGTLAV